MYLGHWREGIREKKFIGQPNQSDKRYNADCICIIKKMVEESRGVDEKQEGND